MKPLHVTEAQALTHNVLGTGTQVLLSSKDTDGQFALYRVSAQPGQGVPLHVHANEDETFLIRAGQVKFEVEGKTITARPGDVVFGPRKIAHSWFAVGETPCLLDIVTTPAAMETMFAELAAVKPGEPMERVLEICARAEIRFL